MKQMSKNEVYVTCRIGSRETEKILLEFPELTKRVRSVEQCYGIKVTQCTYEPNRGNLLTMKYTERSGGENIPAAA